MLKGGLPPFLLTKQIEDRDYLEWIDSYWAKDVQELFVIEKRASFMKFIELLFRQSGERFEAQSFAAPCEISRQTIFNYLEILDTTLMVSVLRPFSDGGSSEVKSQPKIFGFDTGFVNFFRGVSDLSNEDRGNLLEHLVLGEIQTNFLKNEIFYWQDKQKHEIDFVVKKNRSRKIDAIECKSKLAKFDPSRGLKSFRSRYPEGKNILVTLDQQNPELRMIESFEVTVCGYDYLLAVLNS
jgi:predicted AAA+ superfamily ATPase